MIGFNTKMQSSVSTVMRYWQRMPLVIRAIVSGVIVSSLGVYSWLVVGTLMPAPWSIVVMGIMLWLFWKYFSGSWWPKSTSEARRKSFRSISISSAVWRWSLVVALLIIIIWQSGMVLTFRIIEFPAESFMAGYDLGSMPILLAWLMIIMASLVAGICEEVGYRGYMQVPLEKRYPPGAAITMVSLMFLVIHLQQAWAPPVLFHLFALSAFLGTLAYTSGSLIPGIIAHTGLDIFNFAYWWTDVAGTFDRRPLTDTGIDAHFLVWVSIFGASVVMFYWAARKTLIARRQFQEG